MMSAAVVTRRSLPQCFPIVSPQPLTALPVRVWSHDQMERIRRGCIAPDMDAKWDVFVEGNVAYLHRSWTGFGIFEATFATAKSGWRVSAAVVEREPSRYRRSTDRLERVILELVISSVLLGEPAAELRAEMVTPMRRPSASPREGGS
ncbi:hypothetical protein Acsp02_85520 [Actinoplanes sp. NBRC 103695]|nr:hypothetical protein Acsp02_85520 [Actinoplanes sp. NBRC 103695]